jgi:hypothetical protein
VFGQERPFKIYTLIGAVIGVSPAIVDCRKSEMSNKKSFEERIIETFTKSRDERYAESSKKEKLFYWIFVAIVGSIIAYVWIAKLGFFH